MHSRRWLPWLFLANLVLLWPTYRNWPITFLHDEAYVVLGVQRWLQGEWPFSDWLTHIAPGSYCLALPWMALFGTDQWGTRSLMGVLAALQGLVVWELARPLQPWARGLAWLCWATLGMMEIPILNYHWFSLFFFSLAALAAREWVAGTRRADLALGLGVALSGWSLQSEGLAGLFLIAGCWLGFRPPGLARVLASLVVSSLVLWGPFLPHAGEVLEQNVLFMRGHQSWNRFHYSWAELGPSLEGARQSSLAADPAGASYAWLLVLVRAFKYCGLAPLLGLAALRLWRSPQREVSCLLVATLALGLANFNRQTLHYSAYLLPLAFPLMLWEISHWPGFRKMRWAGLATLLSFCLLDGYLWQRDNVFPIETPSGRYWTWDRGQQQGYALIDSWLAQPRRENQEVLCFPYEGALYSLWHLRNPLAEPVLVPLECDLRTAQEAAQRIDQRKVPWILFVPLNGEVLAREHDIDPAHYEALQQEFYRVLTAHYEVVQQVDILQWLRRNPE